MVDRHNSFKGVERYIFAMGVSIDHLEMQNNVKYHKALAEMDACLSASW